MAIELTWLGHGTWLIETAGKRIVLDPFLDENPAAPVKAGEMQADYCWSPTAISTTWPMRRRSPTGPVRRSWPITKSPPGCRPSTPCRTCWA